MKRLLFVFCGLALCVGVSGCGTPADKAVRTQISLMNELADAMENKAPQSQILEIQKRIADNDQKFHDLPLSAEEKTKLIEKHREKYEKAMQRLISVNFINLNEKLGSFKFLAPPGGVAPAPAQN